MVNKTIGLILFFSILALGLNKLHEDKPTLVYHASDGFCERYTYEIKLQGREKSENVTFCVRASNENEARKRAEELARMAQTPRELDE